MSEATTETPPAEPKPQPETDWKAEARKWEQRAKENKSAADELEQIKQAQKTEAEKAADRLAKAEAKAADAEARATRREIALEHRLSKDDADLLDTLTDEDAMRRLAERLAAAASDNRRNGNHVRFEGHQPTPKDDPLRTFTRQLFHQEP